VCRVVLIKFHGDSIQISHYDFEEKIVLLLFMIMPEHIMPMLVPMIIMNMETFSLSYRPVPGRVHVANDEKVRSINLYTTWPTYCGFPPGDHAQLDCE
jgi:hypothetical protein